MTQHDVLTTLYTYSVWLEEVKTEKCSQKSNYINQKYAHETTKIIHNIFERILNKLYMLCMIFVVICALFGYRDYNRKPSSRQYQLYQLHYHTSILTKFGHVTTVGGAAQRVHLRLPYTQKGLSTTAFPGSNYTVNNQKLDLKKRLHIGSRIESSFSSMNVILYQIFLLLREEYDMNVRWDTEWMYKFRSFAVSKTLYFPHHHQQ